MKNLSLVIGHYKNQKEYTLNSVLDPGSNKIMAKTIRPKGPKLCSAKGMASLHCSRQFK